MVTSRRVQAKKMRKNGGNPIPQDHGPLLAIGYVRVSTEEQGRAHGKKAQEQAIRTFAESQGYYLIDVIADEVSGATDPTGRPGFSKVLDLAEAGVIVLVWKFDRLSRTLFYSVSVTHELTKRGVGLRSITEPIDTSSPMGQAFFAVLAGLAAQERQNIVDRTIGGKKSKAQEGGFAGGMAPTGYRRNGKGGLEVNEKEAQIIRRIFSMRKAGATYTTIAEALNNDNVPTRREGKWHPATVRYILDNPKYKGNIEYAFEHGGEKTIITKGKHKAIV